jgi:methionyl-tRNA formyltransferase
VRRASSISGRARSLCPRWSNCIAAGYPILAVVSQPPKPAGRGMRLQPTPVHSLAESLGLPVLTPRARPRP